MNYTDYFDVTTAILTITLVVLVGFMMVHWRRNDAYDWMSTGFVAGEAGLLINTWVEKHIIHDSVPNAASVIIWTFLVVISIVMTLGVAQRVIYGKRPEDDQSQGNESGRR